MKTLIFIDMTALEFLNKKREEHFASGGLALGIDQIRPMLAQWMDEWADTKQKLIIANIGSKRPDIEAFRKHIENMSDEKFDKIVSEIEAASDSEFR